MSDQTPSPADRLLAGPSNFAQAMRSEGIHVGMGRNPVCVTCGDPWPCAPSSDTPDTDRSDQT